MSKKIAESVGREVLAEAASRYELVLGSPRSAYDGILPDADYLDNFDATLFEMAEVADAIATEFQADQITHRELAWVGLAKQGLRGTGLDRSRLFGPARAAIQAEMYADVVGKREAMSGLEMEVPLSELAA